MSEFFTFANNHPFWAIILALIVAAPFRYMAICVLAMCMRQPKTNDGDTLISEEKS
jgi:hypothetical protein